MDRTEYIIELVGDLTRYQAYATIAEVMERMCDPAGVVLGTTMGKWWLRARLTPNELRIAEETPDVRSVHEPLTHVAM